jgi:2-hydroxy-3-keto-5-methylthiopentenyl-1-phosphate phosphatase
MSSHTQTGTNRVGVVPALFLDFDGTITEEDTLVLLLDRFGRRLPDGRDWRAIEFDDSLPENVKLQAEMDLLDLPLDEALGWLDVASPLREGCGEFLREAREHGLAPVVLSGGFVEIIERRLGELLPLVEEVRANRLERDPADGRWRVVPAATPRVRDLCNHCKTWHLREARAAGRPIVYIGDGSTDFCPARESDLVFARSSLAAQLQSEGRPYMPFTTFRPVMEEMRRRDWRLPGRITRPTG